MLEARDFMDFIKDECDNSAHREEFIKQVDKEGTTPKELQMLLHSWGYHVRTKDCETVLLFCHSQGLSAEQLEPRY